MYVFHELLPDDSAHWSLPSLTYYALDSPNYTPVYQLLNLAPALAPSWLTC